MSRIYRINDGTRCHLVRANTPAQAIRYVAKQQYTHRVASQDDIIEALQSGAQIDDATATPEPTQE